MDKSYLESLMLKVQNPERVCVNFIADKYCYIESAEKTNDTLGWFTINGNIIEKELEKEGYSWIYVFETAPKQSPMIYMFLGKELSKETLKESLKDIEETLPEGRKICYEDNSFSTIDVDQYDNSMTFLEKEICRKASDVLRVFEA